MFMEDITLTESRLGKSIGSENYASLGFSLNDQNFSVAKTKP